ncbi:ATP synthase small subunit 6, mitochondrial isoform X1 [Quercus suber]|uniref:ATP synthase small subunit 6, mitochondrial isoform X1 n=1 Tax=Quercus suber TaxID=58331 RepID=UPI000CE27F63|nr:uncharacterized protein LOC111996445 isoform X1 [Quercus suber]
MRKFDPWPVFFKREWNRNWPFIVGFATTGAIITKYSLSLTEEDAKKSPFVQRHKKKYVEKYPDVIVRLNHLNHGDLANVWYLC